MATEKRITGAVSGGGMVFRAGSEPAFDEFLKTDAGKKVDLKAMTAAGHLQGYADADLTAPAEAVNMQTDADGKAAKKATGKKK